MNNCPQEARIQAYVDGELSRQERKELALHLDQCDLCRQALLELKRLTAWADEALAESFAPLPEEAKIDVEQAWSRFEAKLRERTADASAAIEPTQPIETIATPPQTKRSWFSMAKTYQKWIAGTAAAALVVSVLTIPQVQAAADGLLSIFRVNKVEMVKVTQEDLQSIGQLFSGHEIGEKTINGLGKFWVDETREQQNFESLDGMKAAGVSPIALPAGYEFQHGGIQPEYTINMQLDTDKANKMLAQLNAGVKFDEKLNDKHFALTFPKTTSYQFGQNNGEWINYKVFSSPKLNVPADVDVEELRRTILASPLLPQGVSAQLSSIKDWKTTLPIPFFEGKKKAEDVKVKGNSGLFLPEQYGNSASLMWEADGEIHNISLYFQAEMSDQELKAKLLSIANSL